MELFVAFMFGVLLLSMWELRGGPRWRSSVVLVGCAVLAVTYMSQRVV